VLEHLGLGVDSIPRHLEDLRQEQLEQAVVADDLERDTAALRRQADPSVGGVLGETQLVELAHHGGHRARSYAEPPGEGARGHGLGAS
jgi:hypothetical protein